MKSILKEMREALKAASSASDQESARRFIKEDIKLYGVRAGVVRKIGRQYWGEIKNQYKGEVFNLADKLFESGFQEEVIIGNMWLHNLKKEWQPTDFASFERFLKKYINNWAKCDDYCSQVLGEFFIMFPETVSKTHAWRKSRNRWVRRVSAVCLIKTIKNRKELNEVFKVSDELLEDEDDMVQKGYGWLLKEASNLYEDEVFKYVIKNKERMPRTSLRYAIEKMPESRRVQAMA